MTTSGVTAYSLTARDIVATALEENGIIRLGSQPKANELDACLRRLNSMLKSWQSQGLEWKHETISLSCTANDATTALASYVQSVNGVRYYESATNERQMARFERDEYLSLPNKAASGTPTIYYVNEGDSKIMSVWPVPTANYTLKVDIVRKFDTVTNAGETVDIPEHLTETIYANLAVRCAGLFGTQSPPELLNRAAVLERQMLDNMRPASYFLGPE